MIFPKIEKIAAKSQSRKGVIQIERFLIHSVKSVTFLSAYFASPDADLFSTYQTTKNRARYQYRLFHVPVVDMLPDCPAQLFN